MNGMNLSGKPGMVQPMQMPPTLGQPPTPLIQPRLGTLHLTTGPQQPSLTMHFGRAVLGGEVALLVVAGPVAALVHGGAEQPLRPQRVVERDHRRLAGRLVEQVEDRLGQVVGVGRAARARTRSGCRPSTSSPSRGSRARPWPRSGCRPWRGCRRSRRRCRRPARPAPWARGGRATRWSSSAGRCRGCCRSRTSSPRCLIASLGIDPSTTRTNGSSSPRSALKNHSMKSSAPPTGPHSKSISGQCTAILGSPGSAPRAISSMLGWVAAVSATESPSQLSPALIQRTWTTASSGRSFGYRQRSLPASWPRRVAAASVQ